jgi:tRNA(Ile)-lysidine synthase
MRTTLERSILHNIRAAQMIAPGDRIGVAVSGGADSVALLRILQNLREELGITLLVVHFNHMLRGEDSQADAQFVNDLAGALGLEIVTTREDVSAAAALRGWNLEDAARRLRYAFFEDVCATGQSTRVAVAHTAQDQAETVLAHLIRGTGPTGLAGIYPKVGSVIRPLLATQRRDLRDYLKSLNQPWREDATNRDTKRQRARIREQLLPLLENNFAPTIVSHLGELARLSREEELFCSAIVEDRFHAHTRQLGQTTVIRVRDLLTPLDLNFSRTSFSTEDNISNTTALRPLTERLIRRLYQSIRGDRKDLTAQHVEQIIRLASEQTSGHRLELPCGFIVERSFDNLIFSHAQNTARIGSEETLAPPRTYQYVVDVPSCGVAVISVPELASCFRLKVIDWTLQPRDTKSAGQVLDADLLRAPLILRNWRPGDAYRPRGRRHIQKLKQMFLQNRIPGRERGLWPVLECEGRVIWTRGMPPATEFCAREQTLVGVSIEEHPLESSVHSLRAYTRLPTASKQE